MLELLFYTRAVLGFLPFCSFFPIPSIRAEISFHPATWLGVEQKCHPALDRNCARN